jgi:hypothetical protein
MAILHTPGTSMRDIEAGAVRSVRFGVFARGLATLAGRPAAFGLALAAVVVWAVTGPLFGYSDTWQRLEPRGHLRSRCFSYSCGP